MKRVGVALPAAALFLITAAHADGQAVGHRLISETSAAGIVSPERPRWSHLSFPTLVVRGEWDSLCTDQDAEALLGLLGSQIKFDVKIERATHLMHLEAQRVRLYDVVNEFLKGSSG